MRFSLASIPRFVLKHIFSVGVVVGVVILLVGFFVVLMPRYQHIQTLGGLNYKQKEAVLAQEEQYLKQLQALRADLQTISNDDLARLDVVLPKGKDIPGIFRQMQAFAKDANMSLLSVSVADGSAVSSTSTTASSGSVHTLTVSVVLSGQLDYARMKSFLNVVSKQAPLLDLTAIAYTPTATASSTYNFAFRSYYLQP